jgi:homoserine kinase type II
MHLAGRDFPLQQPNLRGLPWWRETAPQCCPSWTRPSRAAASELAYQEQLAASPRYADLLKPPGPIHADLFRDNVMFEPASPAASG